MKSSFYFQIAVGDSLLVDGIGIYSYDGDSKSADIWMTDESGSETSVLDHNVLS